MKIKHLVSVAALALALAAIPSVQAQEVYGGVSLPYGVTIGYAHAFSDSFTLRGDFNGGGTYKNNGQQGGAYYNGTVKAQYLGIYADWFPTSTGFRLTGGLTFNDTRFSLTAAPGQNTTANIGGTVYNLTGQSLTTSAKFSEVAPYLGIGWGHKKADQKGLGFYADLGVMLGKFTADPIKTTAPIPQANLDAERVTLQSKLNKVQALPVVGLGLVYRF